MRKPRRTGLTLEVVQLYVSLMEIVIDTSAIIAVIAGGAERAVILDRTVGVVLTAPASIHWEVGNAFSAMFRRGRITLAQARQALRSYERMSFRFVDIDLGQSLDLAQRLNLYAYDAYVLACALNSRTPLLTLDRKLAVAAASVGIRTLEVEP